MEAAAELFLGTWRYEAQMSVGGTWTDYLHFSGQGFAVWAFSVPHNSQSMRIKPQVLWFKIEPPGTLRFGHLTDPTGWTREYRFENDECFVMRYDDKSWSHQRMATEEVPDWVVAAIDAALKE